MTQQQIAPPTNALAPAGLTFGILAWVVGLILGGTVVPLLLMGLFGLLAIIFGLVGINTAKRLGGQRRGQAIAAVVLGFTPLIAVLIRSLFVM